MESLLSLVHCWGCCRLAAPYPSDALCPPGALDAVCLLSCLELVPATLGWAERMEKSCHPRQGCGSAPVIPFLL